MTEQERISDSNDKKKGSPETQARPGWRRVIVFGALPFWPSPRSSIIGFGHQYERRLRPDEIDQDNKGKDSLNT
jgi:hypothetical protein